MKRKIIEIHAATFYLAKNPEATAMEVGAYVEKSERTIQRWATTAEWHDALDALGYEGQRNWQRNVKRDIQRDAHDFAFVKETYFKVIAEGFHPRNAARETAKRTRRKQRTIQNWEKQFGWRDQAGGCA